jgi:tRNA 2-thiouridine synthesizing protein A
VNPADAVRTETLLADVDRLRGAACPACAAPMDGRGILAAIWLGFRDAPRCTACVAHGLGRAPEEFRRSVRDALLRRECFREAWEATVDRDGPEDDGPADARPRSSASHSRLRPADVAPPSATWDAGDLGCGDLVLELRTRLRAMAPGATLELIAHDLGAPEDLPAWCGLTGHRLLRAAPPVYLIQRKDD